MKRYLVITMASLGFATGANAQTPGPEDLQAIVNNLGPTVDALADGLGDTANTLISTQSAVQTSAALGDTVVNTTHTAINGAPNIAALGLLATLGNNGVQQTLSPYLTAIDDPTAANIQAALAPEDLNTIAENLETTPHALLEGAEFGPNGNGLRSAAINLLKGRIAEGVSENVSRDVTNAVGFGLQELTQGTNLAPLGTVAAFGGFGVVSALEGPVLEPLDGPASQLADAGAPLTEPIIGTLEAGF